MQPQAQTCGYNVVDAGLLLRLSDLVARPAHQGPVVHGRARRVDQQRARSPLGEVLRRDVPLLAGLLGRAGVERPAELEALPRVGRHPAGELDPLAEGDGDDGGGRRFAEHLAVGVGGGGGRGRGGLAAPPLVVGDARARGGGWKRASVSGRVWPVKRLSKILYFGTGQNHNIVRVASSVP